MRVLLIHSQTFEAAAIRSLLRSGGATADHAGTAAEASECLQAAAYDAIVLDGLPEDIDGCSTIHRLRGQGITAPILLLTSLACGRVHALALRAGADDVLVRPYVAEELAARVESIVRRCGTPTPALLHIGPLAIDLAGHTVRIGDCEIGVTCKEFAILQLLEHSQGRLLTKQKIADRIYGGQDRPETRTIDVFMCNLRKKLADAGLAPLIETVRGQGYVMHSAAPASAERVSIAA